MGGLMVKARFDAKVSELESVIDFVNDALIGAGCEKKLMPTMDIAVEEIFVNIALYAYEELPDADRYAEISVDIDKAGEVRIVFEDEGVEYNPLIKEDPDITLNAHDREIGGLGIYMVKKSMDNVEYERVDGKNILKIVKKCNPIEK